MCVPLARNVTMQETPDSGLVVKLYSNYLQLLGSLSNDDDAAEDDA